MVLKISTLPLNFAKVEILASNFWKHSSNEKFFDNCFTGENLSGCVIISPLPFCRDVVSRSKKAWVRL